MSMKGARKALKSSQGDWGCDVSISVKIFLINLLILFFFLGGWVFIFHFSTDDYDINSLTGLGDYVIPSAYRFSYGIVANLLEFMQINVIKNQTAFGIVCILVWALCSTQISCELLKYFESKSKLYFLINLGTLFLFANAFIGEWFWFAEAYVAWILAIPGASYGAIFMARDGLRNWIMGFFFLLILAGAQQNSIPIYVFVVMTLLFFKSEGKVDKRAIFSIAKAAGTLALAVIVDVVLSLIYVSARNLQTPSRVGSIKTFLSAMKDIGGHLKEIWIRCYGILPYGILFIFLVMFLAILIHTLVRAKTGAATVFFVILILLSGQAAWFLISSSQEIFWNTMRTAAPLFGVFSCLIWLIAYWSEHPQIKFGRDIAVSTLLGILFLFVNFIPVQMELTDVLLTNAADQMYIQRIQARITSYEAATGNTITEVGFIRDQAMTYKYYTSIQTADYWGDIAVKSFSTDWSDLNSLNYYTGRSYTKIGFQEIPDDICEYVQNRDWTEENLDEQLIFRENALYIAVY